MRSEKATVSPMMPADDLAQAAGADALSDMSRLLIRIVAVLFALLGLVLFIAPDWVSPNFLWKVPIFAIMTMGGWYLGTAILAWEIARVWRWAVVYPAMVFLWSFSLLELGVLLAHSDLLRISAAFGWPYLAVIVLAAITSLYSIYDWVRVRPRATSRSNPTTSTIRLVIVLFIILVSIIAIFPLLGYGKNRQVFPEQLTVFTLQAFGVFYLSLVIGAVPLLWEKHILPFLFYARTGLALIMTITLAAALNLSKFDFSVYPGGAIYWAAYLFAGVIAGAFVARYWSYSQQAEREA